MVDLGIKSAVKEWMSNAWNKYVKQPISDKTKQLEDSASSQFNTYSAKAKATAYKPVDYYWKQEAFYRGLFWIAVVCLVVMWIISGG